MVDYELWIFPPFQYFSHFMFWWEQCYVYITERTCKHAQPVFCSVTELFTFHRNYLLTGSWKILPGSDLRCKRPLCSKKIFFWQLYTFPEIFHLIICSFLHSTNITELRCCVRNWWHGRRERAVSISWTQLWAAPLKLECHVPAQFLSWEAITASQFLNFPSDNHMTFIFVFVYF